MCKFPKFSIKKSQFFQFQVVITNSCITSYYQFSEPDCHSVTVLHCGTVLALQLPLINIIMKQKKVHDILAETSKRPSLSEAQKRALRNNAITDIKEYFYNMRRDILWLIRLFKPRTDSFIFSFLVYGPMKSYLRHTFKLNYQDVLDIHKIEINEILAGHNIILEIDGINDVARWSGINAEFTSWFGSDNRITVFSGTMYFSHLFCRSVEPLLVSIDKGDAHSAFERYFRNMFKRSCIGFLTNNHRKGWSRMFLIPKDSSMLEGIEKFIISHEMGHAFFSQYGISAWPYELLSHQRKELISSDEEIGADTFAIQTLHHIYLKHNDQKRLMWGACMFFLVFSLFEEERLISIPTNHPSSKDRYYYLMDYIHHVDSSLYEQYIRYEKGVLGFWEYVHGTVKQDVLRYKDKRQNYLAELDQIETYTKHYLRCSEEGEE